MSNATATLPDPQVAYNNLFDGVHARVFFAKCAAAGYQPRNDEEAAIMLESVGKLRMLHDYGQFKSAADADNPFFAANNELDTLLQKAGLDGFQQNAAAQQHEQGVKAAAAELMQDPTFYNSVLALKVAEAEGARADFAAWQQRQAA